MLYQGSGDDMTRKGFTLIEMIVVVAIIGFLVTITFPSLSGSLQKQNVRTARDAVASLHSKARAVSIRRGLRTTLHLTSGVVYITTSHPVTGVRDTIDTVQDIPDRFGVGFTTARDSLVFDARGIGTESSSTLIIVSQSGFSDSVSVSKIGRLVK